MTLSTARVLHGGKTFNDDVLCQAVCLVNFMDNNTSQHLITAWCMQGTMVGTQETRPTNPGRGPTLAADTGYTESYRLRNAWCISGAEPDRRLCPRDAPAMPCLSSQLYHGGNHILQGLQSLLRVKPRGSY